MRLSRNSALQKGKEAEANGARWDQRGLVSPFSRLRLSQLVYRAMGMTHQWEATFMTQ